MNRVELLIKLYTLRQIAKACGVSMSAVQKWAKRGYLPKAKPWHLAAIRTLVQGDDERALLKPLWPELCGSDMPETCMARALRMADMPATGIYAEGLKNGITVSSEIAKCE